MASKHKLSFNAIDQKWQQYWEKNKTFYAEQTSDKPKYYILDMFPYPSGSGLHVGHPRGYVASDIIARYKKAQGYNILHPMGSDAFGLPAEQHAIETGTHPAATTKCNIKHYQTQLKKLGLAIDWDRNISTADPQYYRWTQTIFLQLFNSWYDKQTNQAKSIEKLKQVLSRDGSKQVDAARSKEAVHIEADEWMKMDENAQEKYLNHYRLAYRATTQVNWCPALGTVLANDEVKEGRSERGGHPVEQREMTQWHLRTTAYADRLLDQLEQLDWPQSTKEIQKQWIGRSTGAMIYYTIEELESTLLPIYTTKPETIYGVTYIAIAPENPLTNKIIQHYKEEIEAATLIMEEEGADFLKRERSVNDETEGPIEEIKKRYKGLITHLTKGKKQTARERMQAGSKSGFFTGIYATHPLTQAEIPIYIADYVIQGYATGAIMGVPGHDKRDEAFAAQYKLPIYKVYAVNKNRKIEMAASGLLNGLPIAQARKKIAEHLKAINAGKETKHYKLRDAVFGRQRYWGEPIPIYYKGETPYPLPLHALPLQLPAIDNYKPTSEGTPPLTRAENWTYKGNPLESTTMPSWAGSNWYYIRYLDPNNSNALAKEEALQYWKQPDLYMGGAEHATGHLIYARFIAHFLYDLGILPFAEPFPKLLHQGLIQSTSHFIYRIENSNRYVSHGIRNAYTTTPIPVDLRLVDEHAILNIEAIRKWRKEFEQAEFILEEGQYICGTQVEKMSKTKHNTLPPEAITERNGADALRLYIMFLGPITQATYWDPKGIEGINRFLKRVWRLVINTEDRITIDNTPPSKENLRTLHEAIARVTQSIENYHFNTAISAMMVASNQFTQQKCHSRSIIEPFLQILAPFAPHIAEELWEYVGQNASIVNTPFPQSDRTLLKDTQHTYAITINGKRRAELTINPSATEEEIKKKATALPQIEKWINGKKVKKIIVIPQKIINIVF